MSAVSSTPAQLGFSMPAEWEPHVATWTSWPFDDDLWEGHLAEARRDMAGLISVIARFEPVILNVRNEGDEADALSYLREARADLAAITFNRLPLNDIWFRDNGPIFIRNEQGEVALTDWIFNAWGGKYSPWDLDDAAPKAVAQLLDMKRFPVPLVMEGGALEVNSRGVCLTTRSCLLSPHRNPQATEADLEQALEDNLGLTNIVWLEEGLEGDHTDGHIDTIVRFTDDRTIVCVTEDDENDPNHLTMKLNLERLKLLRDQEGEPYTVVPLPLPKRRMELNGVRLALTYANFYIGNGFVVVPLYDDVNDELALEILRGLFPDREVIGSLATGLITGGGAFHCVTQQQPAGPVFRGS
jgi:agmatine deiminase